MARYYAHITGEANILTIFNPFKSYTGNSNYLRIEYAGNITTNATRDVYVWRQSSGNWFSFEQGSFQQYMNLGSTTYVTNVNDTASNRRNFNSSDPNNPAIFVLNNGTANLTFDNWTTTGTYSGNFSDNGIVFFPFRYAQNLIMDFYEVKIYGINDTLLYDFVPDYNESEMGLRDKVSGNFHTATDQSKIQLFSLTTFEIQPEEEYVLYTSGTTTITLTADEGLTWTASTNDSWLSLSTLTGAGDGSITITYAENEAFQSRTGTVTFTSSIGDVLTFTIEQAKKLFIAYDRPIYRSGSLVKKMYRSGELIYIRLNPPTEQTEPEPPIQPEPTYQQVEVTADFDRSIPFTKVRWDFSKSWYDGYFSELPNINCDNKGWTSIRDAEWGYAGQYTMNLSAKKCYIRNQSTDSYDLYDMYAITTQVDTNLYEYEYSVPLYWGGVSSSSLYDNGLGIYVYVEVNPTN